MNGATSLSAFDLDHTLLKSNASFAFGRYLLRRGILTTTDALALAGAYLLCKVGMTSLEQLHRSSARILFRPGRSKAILDEVSPFLDEALDQLYDQDILDRLRVAQRSGERVALYSSAPKFILHPIAERLGITDWLATDYNFDTQGQFTGIDHVVTGVEKADLLHQRMEEFGIRRSDVTVYSDHYSDLPFLECAGQPMVVRPSRRLAAHARRHSWVVL